MIALVHTLSGGQTKSWVSSAINTARPLPVTSSTGREPLQYWMRRAERNWAKSVKQRHELIAQDWPTSQQNMNLCVSPVNSDIRG